MNTEHIKDIEMKIAGLKARWPAHSVSHIMWQEIEDLEHQLDKAKKEASR